MLPSANPGAVWDAFWFRLSSRYAPFISATERPIKDTGFQQSIHFDCSSSSITRLKLLSFLKTPKALIFFQLFRIFHRAHGSETQLNSHFFERRHCANRRGWFFFSGSPYFWWVEWLSPLKHEETLFLNFFLKLQNFYRSWTVDMDLTSLHLICERDPHVAEQNTDLVWGPKGRWEFLGANVP